MRRCTVAPLQEQQPACSVHATDKLQVLWLSLNMEEYFTWPVKLLLKSSKQRYIGGLGLHGNFGL